MGYKFIRVILIYISILSPQGKYHCNVLGKPPMQRMTSNEITVTAVRCIDYDPSYERFVYCNLKPINRKLKLFSARAALLQPPVRQATATLKFYKRANGYKPFPINVSIDICKYMNGSRNIIYDWFYNAYIPYSNANHSCPFETDFILHEMPVNAVKLPSVFPDGEYRVDLIFHVENILRAAMIMYAKIQEP